MHGPIAAMTVVADVIGDPEQLVAQWGYFIVFFVVLAQCTGVPLPAVAVLLAAQAAARSGTLSLAVVITIGSAGAILGSTLGYILGRIGGRSLLVRIARLVRAGDARIDAMERFFDRHGSGTVFLGRWVIFVRLWGSIAAGAARMPWPRFMFWNVLGGILWVSSLSVLAYVLGSIARSIAEALDIGGWILLPVVVVGFVVWGLRRRGRRDGLESTEEQPAEPASDDSD